MKAISLWQPWATLIAIGAKRIETRGWDTRYRGPLAIHAAKKVVSEVLLKDEFFAPLDAAGYWNSAQLPQGKIVAVCDLVATFQVETQTLWPDGWLSDMTIPPAPPELYFGDYTPGRFAWLLTNVRALREPIPWRGRQMFFDLPDNLLLEPQTMGGSR